MSEATKPDQQEPSMEEILASIRRIISDDGTEQPNADASSAGAKEESKDSPSEASEVSAEGEATDAAAEQSDPPVGEEPLDLTEAVQDDGTVIDLAAQRAAQARAPEDRAAEESPKEEPPVEEAVFEEVIPEDVVLEEGAGDPASGARVEVDVDSDSVPQPFAEEPSAAGLELYAEDQDTATPSPETEVADGAAAPAEDSMSDIPRSDDADHDRLVSAATEAAALTALSEVTRSPASEAMSLPGGDRTLEQVVRDAISEYLKIWLDANLPTLVERVVREEVRRLARRAEDT